MVGYYSSSSGYGNPSLSSLTGLNNVDSIGSSLFFWHNSSLTNLQGLESVISIGGAIGADYTALKSFNGIENLTSVVGISLVGNDSLTSLKSLENIKSTSISYLKITNNTSLSECDVKSVCDYLINPGGWVYIYGNATGCNSEEEVKNSCTNSMPENNYSEFILYPNPAKTEFLIKSNNGETVNELIIYNQFGQIIRYQKVVKENIDVSSLKRGLYIIELVTKNTTIKKKLIIN